MRKYPIGTEITEEGASFRIYANKSKKIDVSLKDGQVYPLLKEKNGYFSGTFPNLKEGALYKFRINEKDSFPDPFSKFQPKGPHDFSELVRSKFKWSDAKWKGIQDKEKVILYELHIGTFTQEGTWLSAINKLPHLAELGINVLEMMPIAEFPGGFNWGYDGVNLFAPTHNYGSPDDLRKFINEAHKLGLGVILDVVYNHFGPDGNYIEQFTDKFFKEENTEWGKALNYENPEVRSFFVTNATYWIEEFHFDGLRFDACHAIVDSFPIHILAEITKTLRNKFKNKNLYIIAENEKQEIKLVSEYGLDGVWNEDFHHTSFVRCTGHKEAYYNDYQGKAQEFVSTIKHGFLYQGQWYSWQKRRRGSAALDAPSYVFINFLENHDQVANSSLTSSRIRLLTQPAIYRAITSLLFLSPQTPFLFQGQEFGSIQPFFFFCDHEKELASKVAKGREEFLMQFESFKEFNEHFPVLNDKNAFLQSKLNWDVKDLHTFTLHKDLIEIRKKDTVFGKMNKLKIDGAVINENAFIIRYTAVDEERLLIINFGSDFFWDPAPEPLLAPPMHFFWKTLWSSENPIYGGNGFQKIPTHGNWHIRGPTAIILGSIKP